MIGGTLEVASGLIISCIDQDTSFLSGPAQKFCEARGLDESLFFAILRQLDLGREQFLKNMEEFSEGQKKKVLIAGRIAGGRLLLTIDNTYSRPTRQDISGVYLSSKHAGHGIGIESAKSIARRNGGDLRIQQQDGMFCISISMDI